MEKLFQADEPSEKKEGCEKNSVYISERIINISELESHIRNAKLNFEVFCQEIKKSVPSKSIINGTLKVVQNYLEKAEDFEFCIEKRKCVFKEAGESPKEKESL